MVAETKSGRAVAAGGVHKRKQAPPAQPVAGSPRQPRQRVAKGPTRPAYLHNLENDRLMMIITALACEVSALRDRLDTHEALAERKVSATSADVEAFALDDARREVRERDRASMLGRVYRVLFEELNEARQPPRAPTARDSD